MAKGQLTRQELGWLLTQQAQGAAEKLRTGVAVIRNTLPPVAIGHAPQHGNVSVALPHRGTSEPSAIHLDASLDALEDAMRMLSSLHQRPATRSRRGRVDVAALLLEIAPNARMALAPGIGTEVYADEDDVRRMLQVLMSQTQGASVEAAVTRDGDNVRVEVRLGSEGSAHGSDTERAWLHRMAMRYGGRYELEGGVALVELPADGVSERKEREALRKELDEARQQGEMYAQELATAWSERGERGSTPVLAETAHLEATAIVARLSGALMRALRSARQTPGGEAGAGSAGGSAAALVHLEALFADLATIDPQEVPTRFDLKQVFDSLAESAKVAVVTRDTRNADAGSAEPAPDAFVVVAGEHTTRVLLRVLLAEALRTTAAVADAEPPKVVVTFESRAAGIASGDGSSTTLTPPGGKLPAITVCVDDLGPQASTFDLQAIGTLERDVDLGARLTAAYSMAAVVAQDTGVGFHLQANPAAACGVRARLGFSRPSQ